MRTPVATWPAQPRGPAAGAAPRGGGPRIVTVDNENASRNVARAAERAGCVVGIEREGPDYHVRIIKGETAAEAEGQQPLTQTAVMVTSPTLGHGDDALGAILMKAFLYALSQLPSPPQS